MISRYQKYRYEQFLEHSKTTHAMGRVGCTDEVGKKICNQILIPIIWSRTLFLWYPSLITCLFFSQNNRILGIRGCIFYNGTNIGHRRRKICDVPTLGTYNVKNMKIKIRLIFSKLKIFTWP